jgi:acetyl-CoA C-acetyltransferase
MNADPRGVVIVSAARTPTGRFNGALRGLGAVSLGSVAIEAALERVDGRVAPDRILMGNVVQAGNGQNPARAAAVRAGVPATVPGTTLNDVCLASISSVALSSLMIRSGEIDSALVGGFESMSRAPHGIQIRQAAKTGAPDMTDLLVSEGLWCAISDSGMGEISEAANSDLGITRAEQDEVALASHRNAYAAQERGSFLTEIVPLKELATDEGIRPDTSAEALARLRPAFVDGGTITAGNASQMSDAAAAGLVTSRELAERFELIPLAEVVGAQMIAGPDTSLHLKPAVAAERLLDRVGLTAADVGAWEINEAFAGVVVATCRRLGIEQDRVNVNGGAIALGHPLAASGFRITISLMTVMAEQEAEYGIATMCGGGGQGAALLLRAVS